MELWVLAAEMKRSHDSTQTLIQLEIFKFLNNDSEMRNMLLITPAAAAAAKLLQSSPTLCDPIDSSPPGLPVPGILQARTLEWVAISFSNAWKWKVKVKSLSHVRPLATPWTAGVGLEPTRLLRPWDFPGKSTGVGCHCLLRLNSWEMSTFSSSHAKNFKLGTVSWNLLFT